LVDSEKNRLILKKIASFTINVAKYFAKDEVSYKPLKILNHKHKADTLNNLGYYDLIETAIKTEEILPCVDNTYRNIADSIYLSDEFGGMLQETRAINYIGFHIIPLIDKELSDYGIESINTKLNLLNDIVGTINKISAIKLSNNHRSLFISQVVKEASFIKDEYPNQVNFLINEYHKIIKGDEYIYTPVTKNFELKKPSFANIHFINKDLFGKLLRNFEYNSSKDSNKGRFIYDKLNNFCNVYSYEPAKLAQKIISETQKAIKKDRKKAISYIREMNKSLFYNYNFLNDKTKLPENINVPTLTINRKIRSIDTLMLSHFYPTGEKTELIFKNIYTNDNYIGSPKILGLDTKNNRIEDIEEFLRWLGVNEYAMYNNEYHKNGGADDYRDYIKENQTGYVDNRYKTTILKIKKFKKILEKISIEHLILWAYFDSTFKNQINDSEHVDNFYHFYYSYNYVHAPSYIKYKINTLYQYKFQDYLIDDRYSWVNNYSINYRADFFLDNNIAKTTINAILISLGANDSFNTLSIDKVADILNKLPERYPDGKKTQSIYKKALSHYHENSEKLTKNVLLFADDGISLKPIHQSKVYFSDKIKLPKQLKSDYPVFNFPSRAGGADAIMFFGINDLKNVQIDIIDYVINKELSDAFESKLDLLKPLILTYRLNAIEDSNLQKTQASVCNKIKIFLCNKIVYKINNDILEVAEYEFLHYKEYTYFLRINSEDFIEELNTNLFFVNSFADIIVISLDVRRERNEYKQLLRNKDIAIDIKNDFGIDTYNKARELLGLTDYKQAFWKAVFLSNNKKFAEGLDALALENYIKEYLGIEFKISSLDYENINKKSEISKIRSLFNELKINLTDFANNYIYNISLSDIHFESIRNLLLSKKNEIKSAVWKSLKNKTIDEKAKYLNEINRFENYYEFIIQESEKNKYIFEPDTTEIINVFFNNTFRNIDIDSKNNIDIVKIRSENSKRFNKDDLYIIEQSERLKSLLYFNSALDVIRKELLSINFDGKTETNEKDSGLKIKPIITSSDRLKNKKKTKSTANRNNSVFTQKEKNQKKLKVKGNTSEEIVYDFLIDNNYKNVDLVSIDNEGLHYDIRYTDDRGVVKFIEVKTFDNSKFHLSRDEYEFGKNEQDNYEIWLVENKIEIIPIKDFFKNKKYKPITSEYEIYLDKID